MKQLTEKQKEAAIKARWTVEANRVQRQIAHENVDRRMLPHKARRKKGDVFNIVGRVPKSYCVELVVGVCHWRGVTTLELHEYENGRGSGHCIFLDHKHIDELLALIGAARQYCVETET